MPAEAQRTNTLRDKSALQNKTNETAVGTDTTKTPGNAILGMIEGGRGVEAHRPLSTEVRRHKDGPEVAEHNLTAIGHLRLSLRILSQ